MLKRLKNGILTLFNRRTRGSSSEELAFNALVAKFAKIQYLVDQKAMVDVIEKAPVGICITNEHYIYEYVNPAYCEIYGYDFGELIGKSFTLVVPDEHRKELMDLHDRFMHQEYELEGEWNVIRKGGELRKILANAAYVIDENRRPKKITFVLDITDRKHALSDLESEIGRTKALMETIETRVASNVTDALELLENGGGSSEISDKLRGAARALEDILTKNR